METKSLCTLDSRVKNQYVYQPEKERFVTISGAEAMRILHEFRVSKGHALGQNEVRPIYAHEIKAHRS